MIDYQIISGLLCVVANVSHPESQKNAAGTLIVKNKIKDNDNTQKLKIIHLLINLNFSINSIY